MTYINKTLTAPETFANTWRHVALAYDPCAGEDGLFTVYVDGSPIGDATADAGVTFCTQGPVTARPFVLGASHRGNVFQGLFDTWRFTEGVLGKKDFLYQSPCGMVVHIR